MCLKISWLAESFFQAAQDLLLPKDVKNIVKAKRAAHGLLHLATTGTKSCKDAQVQSQEIGIVKGSTCMMYMCCCAFKHLFSYEHVLNSTQLCGCREFWLRQKNSLSKGTLSVSYLWNIVIFSSSYNSFPQLFGSWGKACLLAHTIGPLSLEGQQERP